MKRILILGVVMSLFGCAQTTSDYYYVSLEKVAGAEVVNKRKLELKNLKNNSEIPVEYSILRGKYSLHFLIEDKSYYPHFKITVKSSDGSKLSIKPRRDISVLSGDGTICSSYYLDNQSPSTVDFGWSSSCLSDDIKKEISFDVVDASGSVIASEDIPFSLVNDGKYTLLDAI